MIQIWQPESPQAANMQNMVGAMARTSNLVMAESRNSHEMPADYERRVKEVRTMVTTRPQSVIIAIVPWSNAG